MLYACIYLSERQGVGRGEEGRGERRRKGCGKKEGVREEGRGDAGGRLDWKIRLELGVMSKGRGIR